MADDLNIIDAVVPTTEEGGKPRYRRGGVRSGICLWSEFKGMSVTNLDDLYDNDEVKKLPRALTDDENPRVMKEMQRSGTLQDGEEVDLWAFKNIGFILQYFAVGVIYGGLPATVYGVFLGYLNVPGYVYSTASVIIALPWSFKFVFGMLNDCVPVCGYRRKPYMVFGWSLCAITLFALSFDKMPDPYFCVDENGYFITMVKNATYPDAPEVVAEPCNADARESGGHYALLMFVAAFGYVIADVAADGLMVKYAQREPTVTRGHTQTTVYMVRTFGSILATIVVGLFMNGKEYAGSWSFTLHYNEICGIFAIPASCMIFLSWFCIQEDKVGDNDDIKTFGSYFRQCWDMLRSRAFFFVVLFNFFEPFVGRIATTAGGKVKKEWAGVQNIQNQMFSLLALSVFAFGLYQVKKHFLNHSWRKMLWITTVCLNLTDMFISMVTIFDVFRNQYFYLGESVLNDIPAAANFVVSTFIIVEMAEEGSEGITYGLLSTIGNLGTPFAAAISNQLFSAFEPSLSDTKNYLEDKFSFRRLVALSFGVSYMFSFLSMTFIFLLPHQKEHAQQRKRDWPRADKYAYITLALVFFGLFYSVTVDVMAMIPSTMCLRFAGGSGCESTVEVKTSSFNPMYIQEANTDF